LSDGGQRLLGGGRCIIFHPRKSNTLLFNEYRLSIQFKKAFAAIRNVSL
jgi:hypothetical protein